MWNAYEKYEPDKGPMATYFNYMIRNRLIDLMRQENRYMAVKERAAENGRTQFSDGNHRQSGENAQPLSNETSTVLKDPYLWVHLKNQLTDKQWKWVYYCIIHEMPYKDIAEIENTSTEAVKSWAKQTKKKLRVLSDLGIIDWQDFL